MLNLQTDLYAIEMKLSDMQKTLVDQKGNPKTDRFLQGLHRAHAQTIEKVDKLYASLNVTDSFPEIAGLPLEFVRALLMARDLKINIRKRAVGSFFEWDKLDRAAGGKNSPLGNCESLLFYSP